MDKESRIEALVITLNNQAMKLLKEFNPSFAISKLDQAIQVLQKNVMKDYSELFSMTYYNYGILFNKSKRFDQAGDCYIQASKYCEEFPVKFSECLLRACSIYSKLRQHKKALKLALKSLKALTYSTNQIKIIAFQNAGAQYEYLKMRAEAISIYKSGYSFLKSLYGSESSAAQMFKSRYKKLNDLARTKNHSPLSIITSKPSHSDPYISKTPELKTVKASKVSLIKPAPSLKTLKYLKNFNSFKNYKDKSKTPDKLKSIGFSSDSVRKGNKYHGSGLVILDKNEKFKRIGEGLESFLIVDSKRNSPKNLGSRHLDPIIFSLDAKF